MRLIKFIGKCAPKSLHGWFQTDLGFNVRKPLDIPMWDMKIELENPSRIQPIEPTEPTKPTKTLWQRIREWVRNVGNKTKTYAIKIRNK